MTADGKLVGIMVNRDHCFVLSKENVMDCTLSIPLADKKEFLRAARQFPKIKVPKPAWRCEGNRCPEEIVQCRQEPS